VCNNLEDVGRVKDLVLAAPEFRFIEGTLQDHFASPKDTGYRAMHFLVAYDVLPEGKTERVTVKCEIQIRTHLADAWARLSYFDFYKEGSDLPPHLARLFRRLAALLKVTDEIAQDLREEVSRPRLLTGEPATAEVEPDSLTFIYQRAFGEAPPEYVLQIVANRCREVGATRLDALDRKLADARFLDALRKAYGEEHGLELFDQELFELIPTAVAFGHQAAIDLAKQRAHMNWEELDAQYRRELEAEWLPDTYDEFMDELKSYNPRDPDAVPQRVHNLARFFDATSNCIVCGATIVKTDFLAEQIAAHYNLEDKTDEIEPELFDSGIETGYQGDSTYCNHCGYMLNKDD
jgi:hypothetical protein